MVVLNELPVQAGRRFECLGIEAFVEKAALVAVAMDRQARWLAPPDAQGFTQRNLVTAEQKAFLDSMISGEFFSQFD